MMIYSLFYKLKSWVGHGCGEGGGKKESREFFIVLVNEYTRVEVNSVFPVPLTPNLTLTLTQKPDLNP